MLVAQWLLLELCIRLKSPLRQRRMRRQFSPWSALSNSKAWKELQFRRLFWHWTEFHAYYLCMLLLISVLSFLQVGLGDQGWYVETVGYVALILESGIGVPQLLQNLKRQSTHGLSFVLIASWLLGDAFKTVYFVITKAPAQFLVCGLIQLVVDIIIIGQIVLYRRR
jgi:hypothetical protein